MEGLFKMKKLVGYITLVLTTMLICVGCGSADKRLPLPVLTPDMNTGVGVLADYESEDKIIFHGYFGVFVYDLKAEEILVAVDLEKTLGMNQIQGSTYVDVSVNADGSEMLVCLSGEVGEEDRMAYYINTTDGSYTYEAYKPYNHIAPYGDAQKYSEGTIKDMTYTDGSQTWKLFENWDFE